MTSLFRGATQSTARILVVEDEEHLALGIAHNLRGEGYAVTLVADGEEASQLLTDAPYDLVVLDVMLPRKDGFALCAEARARGVATPILFLSARASAEERTHGLRLGADDYLGKPFYLAEFLGRVAALLRRGRPHDGVQSEPRREPVAWPPTGLLLDLSGGQICFRGGTTADLGQREAAVLRRLWQGRDEEIGREQLLEAAWGHEVRPSSRALEPIVERLRQYLEPVPSEPRWLLTVRGIGYQLLSPSGSK